MNNTEFSNEFDILYNNITSNQAPGLDLYEKSVFLTRAQEKIVIALYNGTLPSGESFEKSEELRRYLDNLVESSSFTASTYTMLRGFKDYSFLLDPKVWYLIYEDVKISGSTSCGNGDTLDVMPVTHDDLARVLRNPFRCPNSLRVLRLDSSGETNNKKVNKVDILSSNSISSYNIRYIVKPSPIILTDLSDIDDSLSIEGESDETECKLNSNLHSYILNEAVQMAKQVWLYGNNIQNQN